MRVTREEREKELLAMFKNYKANKKALKEDYGFPSISGVDFSRISVQTDKSRNIQEDKIISYADEKTRLFAQVYIVDEVMRYFVLEGHGRERFVQSSLINGDSWTKTEMLCCVSRGTMSYWRRDVIEKAEMVADWLNYF